MKKPKWNIIVKTVSGRTFVYPCRKSQFKTYKIAREINRIGYYFDNGATILLIPSGQIESVEIFKAAL